MSNYVVLQPNETFKNKRYIDWIEDWSNWFYQPYPDRNNDGDVVFCRCIPLSKGSYGNEAVVMIGEQSLEISEDQRILFPILTANYVADHYETSDYLFGMVRSRTRQSGIPIKEQILINGEPIDDGNRNESTLMRYEFETPVFPITIPDCPPGVSLKDQMEIPLQTPGLFASVTRGFFVMLELKANVTPNDEYIIESYTTGAPTEYGPYIAGSLYRIIVNESSHHNLLQLPNRKYAPPSKLRYSIMSQLFEKKHKGQLTHDEFNNIKKYLKILDN
jgi:hypothetical protein